MPSVDISQLAKLGDNTGYEVFDAAYRPETEFFRRVTTVKPLSAANYGPLGHRMVGSGDIGALEERKPGQEYPADTLEQGYVRQVAIREFSKSISVPMEVIERTGGEQAFRQKVIETSTAFAARASQYKDSVVAGIMQYGTIATATATSKQFFDQTYPDNPDSNVGYIYDGKPFYAASGNAHPLAHGTVGGSQGINLTVSAALSESTFNDAYTAFTVHNAIDERGLRIDQTPTLLVAGAGMRSTVLRFLNSESLPGTANNDINPWRGIVEPVIWPRLSLDTDAWWLHDPASIWAFDGPLTIKTTYDIKRNSMWIACGVRFGAAVVDWRKSYCANKASS